MPHTQPRRPPRSPAPGTSAEATGRLGWMQCTVQAVTLSKRKTNNLLTILETLNSSPCNVPLCTDTSRLFTGGVGSVDRPSFINQKHTLFIIWAHYYACNIFRAFCAFTFSISKMKTGTRKTNKQKTLKHLLFVYGAEIIKPLDLSAVCSSFMSELNNVLFVRLSASHW